MPDWITAIEALGGGLSAIVIASLAFVSVNLFRWYRQSVDARLEDAKKYAEERLAAERENAVAHRLNTGVMHSMAESLRAIEKEISRNA